MRWDHSIVGQHIGTFLLWGSGAKHYAIAKETLGLKKTSSTMSVDCKVRTPILLQATVQGSIEDENISMR